MNFQDSHQCSVKLSDAGLKTLETARASVGHLRPQTSRGFLHAVENEILEAEKSIDKHLVLTEAEQISTLNWALTLPFLRAAKKIQADSNLIVQCSKLAQQLAGHDIDAAVTFLERTPNAIENFENPMALITWGKQGLGAFHSATNNKKIWRAVKAYFIEASEKNCGYPLDRWSFFLSRQYALQPLLLMRL